MISVNPQQVNWSLDFDQRSELGSVVLNAYFPIYYLKETMCPADTDVRNLHVSLDTSPDFKGIVCQIEDVNYLSWGALD